MLVPALPGRRLLDLDTEVRPPLAKVERRPVASAMVPLGLERHRHHLLDDLAAQAVEEDGGAEEAAGEQ